MKVYIVRTNGRSALFVIDVNPTPTSFGEGMTKILVPGERVETVEVWRETEESVFLLDERQEIRRGPGRLNFKVGDRVLHTNSKRRGTVVEVEGPMSDGTFEYRVSPDEPLSEGEEAACWWNGNLVKPLGGRE